jgi:hypothetical protein
LLKRGRGLLIAFLKLEASLVGAAKAEILIEKQRIESTAGRPWDVP